MYLLPQDYYCLSAVEHFIVENKRYNLTYKLCLNLCTYTSDKHAYA